MMSPACFPFELPVSLAHIRTGMDCPSAPAEIGILQLWRGLEGLRATPQDDKTAHQHVSAGRDGECDCNVLLDQDAADSHLATDPVDRLVHTLHDERRKTERRFVHQGKGRKA